jgi:putative hydrolase of HD superfamily
MIRAMTERAAQIVDTLIALDTMSELPRTGWLLRGVRPCESIADHSYGVALTTMLMIDALRAEGVEVDGEAALRMAILHDAPEARTGDVPMPQKTPEVKAALDTLEARLADDLLTAEARRWFERVVEGDSLEARIVKAADKVQMMTKALVYGLQRRGHLEEFWANDANFKDRGVPLARELFDHLKARRAASER